MKPIGGYFGLELDQKSLPVWLSLAVGVNSSRHALECILRSIPSKPSLVYVPYYTCEVVLEPLIRLGIKYQFYHIDGNFEIESLPAINNDEIIIVNNYFGIKDDYINDVLARYGDHVIVDNAQAFYHRLNKRNRAIYSPRKFFGVPDGGYALTPDALDFELTQDYSTDRSLHLLRRIDAGAEAGYIEFQKDDSSLTYESLKRMSNLTNGLLKSIDYECVKDKRRGNFRVLHDSLAKLNKLRIPGQDTFECPMVYPLLTDDTELRNKLIQSKIFVATYWPNVFKWCTPESVEYRMAANLIPLPVDQRYGIADMQEILKVILR